MLKGIFVFAPPQLQMIVTVVWTDLNSFWRVATDAVYGRTWSEAGMVLVAAHSLYPRSIARLVPSMRNTDVPWHSTGGTHC